MFLSITNNIRNLGTRNARLFFAIFYFVGTIGFLIPSTANLFSYLTPFALFITTVLLMIFHTENLDKKTISIFSIIFLFGYGIEVIGVNTGLIFGDYSYSYGLGPKLINTPLMIGINWLILTYTFDTLTRDFKYSKIVQALIAATAMTSYDIIIEQVAGTLQMWHWSGDSIPIKNYIAWFVIGFIMQLIIKYSKINTKNPLSIAIILCHITFFLILILVNL